MHFRTVLNPEKSAFDINYKSRIALFGSCFAEEIGARLEKFKFNTNINPFGILYNPISIKKAIEMIIIDRVFKKDDIFFYNERWHSFYHHSKFSFSEKEETLDSLNENKATSIRHEIINGADFLFITFGTAWVYELKKTREIVSNCHKLPSEQFRKRLLDADEITVEYFQLINSLQNLNPNLKIVFSISPIRHIKEGFSENMLSKSILKVAISQLTKHFQNVFYFPAYEIMLDDLRDYRFYKKDKIHPNELAVDYIWKKFSESFIRKPTCSTLSEIKKIKKAMHHKVFNPSSEGHLKFKKKYLEKVEDLAKRYKEIDFSAELKFFS